MNEPGPSLNGASQSRGPADGLPPEDAAPDALFADDAGAAPAESESSPAREISLHLLRMLETRIDAAGIAVQGETQLLLARLQLKLLAAAAVFIAIWGGIVLLAIALPPNLRVPVLSAVVAGFVLLAVGAQLYARRKASTHEVGSLHWFLDGLRQDFEVLSRTLTRPPNHREPAHRSAPRDLAA
jgi:uncharacterized membrane protein YqjE